MLERDLVPIKDRKMVRDMSSKAVLSVDVEGLQAHRERRATASRLQDLESQMATVSGELKEIKSMIRDFIQSKMN